jgi:hypothetical protein
MKKIAFFTVSVLAVAVVLVLSGWGTGTNRVERDKPNRLAARRPEHVGERGLIKTPEAYPEREVMVLWKGYPSDTQPEERTLPLAVRVAGYMFFAAVVLAAAIVLGGVIAVGLEYLVGWPDTWWL